MLGKTLPLQSHVLLLGGTSHACNLYGVLNGGILRGLLLTVTLLLQSSIVLHVWGGRNHRLTNVLSSGLIVGGPLLLGLTDALQSGIGDSLRLSLTDLSGVYTLRLSGLTSLNCLICGTLLGIDVSNARLLGAGKRRNKLFGSSGVRRKRRLSHALSTGIDGVIPIQYVLRDADRLCATSAFSAATHINAPSQDVRQSLRRIGRKHRLACPTVARRV